jgi:4-hydroxybenzoate polyprenyltransferase
MNKEALLFAKHSRTEKDTWVPRIAIPTWDASKYLRGARQKNIRVVGNLLNVMSNWLLLAVCVTFMSLNVIDAVLTRMGLRKGYEESIHGTKTLIREYGLDRAMLIKASLLTLATIFVIILGWDNAVFGLVASIAFIFLVIIYSYVVAHNCIELRKSHH